MGARYACSGSRSGRATPLGCWGTGPSRGSNPSVVVWVADDPEGDGLPLRSGNQRLLLAAVAHVGGDARGEASATVWRTGPGSPVVLAAWQGGQEAELNSRRFWPIIRRTTARGRVADGMDMEAWMAGRIAGVLVGILLGVVASPAMAQSLADVARQEAAGARVEQVTRTGGRCSPTRICLHRLSSLHRGHPVPRLANRLMLPLDRSGRLGDQAGESTVVAKPAAKEGPPRPLRRPARSD